MDLEDRTSSKKQNVAELTRPARETKMRIKNKIKKPQVEIGRGMPNPEGIGEGYEGGRGKGRHCHTLGIPLPLWRVSKGMGG